MLKNLITVAQDQERSMYLFYIRGSKSFLTEAEQTAAKLSTEQGMIARFGVYDRMNYRTLSEALFDFIDTDHIDKKTSEPYDVLFLSEEDNKISEILILPSNTNTDNSNVELKLRDLERQLNTLLT